MPNLFDLPNRQISCTAAILFVYLIRIKDIGRLNLQFTQHNKINITTYQSIKDLIRLFSICRRNHF